MLPEDFVAQVPVLEALCMAYSEETKGDFRIGYCHEIPFFGKAKPELKLFGDKGL